MSISADGAGRSCGNVLAGAAENLGRAGDFDRAVTLANAALAEPEITVERARAAAVWARSLTRSTT